MAYRIGDYVVRGEVNNARRNCVFGWLEFGEDQGIRFELAGNLQGQLAGKHLRFEAARPAETEGQPVPDAVESLEVQQIGVVGTSLLRMVKIPRGPIGEFYVRSDLNEPPPVDEKPCLYLEWFSQNGRVVAEIVDPQISFVTDEAKEAADVDIQPEPLPDPTDVGGPEIVGFMKNEQGEYEELSFREGDDPAEDDDPYHLFPRGLDEQLQDAAREAGDAPAGEEEPARRRNWDEVIPGIDEETKRMYEQWDEVCYGTKDEPLTALFDPPISLPPAAEIADEAEAEKWLNALLAQLALHCVAIDICEHFTARDTYRWLLEVILPEAHIHPQLKSTGFVRHYSTWEDCPRCEAEFEAEYEQRNKGENDAGEASAG